MAHTRITCIGFPDGNPRQHPGVLEYKRGVTTSLRQGHHHVWTRLERQWKLWDETAMHTLSPSTYHHSFVRLIFKVRYWMVFVIPWGQRR